jgi:hypothetical protein
MRKSLAILVCGVMLFVGVMAFLAPADAGRRGGARGHGHHHAAHRGHHHRHAAHRHAHRGYAARHNINRNVNVNRNVNANRRIVYRNGVRGYWRNGRWIAAPLVAATGAGVAGYVATCAYEYNRWQATGTAYWRSRYNQCAGI